MYGLDAVRGLAALLVVLFHINRLMGEQYGGLPLGGWIEIGDIGVDIFFVLSGFLMYCMHQNELGERGAVLPFVKKRLCRILPMYWLALLCTMIMNAFSLSADDISIETAFFNLFLIQPSEETIVGVSWTLTLELIFYGVFISALMNRLCGQLAMTLWVVFIVSNEVFDISFSLIGSLFNLYFVFGIIAGVVANSAQAGESPSFKINKSPGVIMCVLIFSLAMFEMTSNGDNELLNVVTKGCIISGLVVFASLLVYKNKNIIMQVLLWLGRCSYTLYLFHLIIASVVLKLFNLTMAIEHFSVVTLSLVMIVITVVVSEGISRLIERPLNVVLRGLISRRPLPSKVV
jgi:exopolysaccharide production protein ExoZ